MTKKDLKIELEDILALEKIFGLIKDFSNKNPIKKANLNLDRFRNKINKLKIESDKETKAETFKNLLKRFQSIIRKEILPEIFYIIGGHGGIIINNKGFCEFDSPEYALGRLIERMNLAISTNIPYHIEVAISCLEWLQNKYPEKIKNFITCFKKGRFEIINPTYSHPYNLIINEESNIKQFEYGLKELNRLGLDCSIYYCSEVSLHPQIPQILNGFGIEFCSLRTRLLGTCPTSNSGIVTWIGLDNSPINTITDQPGIFNGEFWHGTFYKEIPDLLFQAVSRPFMKNLVYSSIEDFIMTMPYQEEVWRISKFSDLFGKFISCVELFKLIEPDGEFKYTRDNFSVGEYMFVESELFLNNKRSEIALINAEMINSILGIFNENSNDDLFDDLWKQLLLTQAHDNYVVPYVQTGDYSAQQLSKEEFEKLEIAAEKIPISELSIKILKDLQIKCRIFIENGLTKIANSLIQNPNYKKENSFDLLVINPTNYSRFDVITIPMELKDASKMMLFDEKGERMNFIYRDSSIKFVPYLPSIGYKIFSLKEQGHNISKGHPEFFYEIGILEDNQTLEIRFKEKKAYELKFGTSQSYQLNLIEQSKNEIETKTIIEGKISNKTFLLELIQYNGVNRLEIVMNADLIEKIILIPAFKISKSLINYPFGIEETKRSNIQTLDFIWLIGKKKSLIYIQKNSQQFRINRKTFEFHNLIKKKGIYEFSIAVLQDQNFCSAYQQMLGYKFNFLGTIIQGNHDYATRSESWLSINPEISLINLWRRKNGTYVRLLNPSIEMKEFSINGLLIGDNTKEVDFKYRVVNNLSKNTALIGAWKIQTLNL